MKVELTEDEAPVAAIYDDINEAGDMHQNPAKNVLYVRSSVEEIARRVNIAEERARMLLDAARKKMYAERLLRPTPYVDKTVYAGWNAMCVSAYLEAARVLDLSAARCFALGPLDRLLAEGWSAEHGMKHVIAYSDPKAEQRQAAVPGVLDDYAFAVIACLDAYEATAVLSYFRFACSVGEAMVAEFFDPVAGGFFDTRSGAAAQAPGGASNGASDEKTALGILGTRRKPFQDSPTPAGNSAAAIALLRLHGYADDASDNDGSHNGAAYRDQAEQTLEVYAGVAGQHGIFAATYGLAVIHFSQPHTQGVVVGEGDDAAEVYRAAVQPLGLNMAGFRLVRPDAGDEENPPTFAPTRPTPSAPD